MRSFTIYYTLLLISSFYLQSCQTPDYQTNYYKAISHNQQDTAYLKLSTSTDTFYGDYQVHYSNKSKDEGSVKGHIVGDTLIGKYTYLSNR